MSCGEPRTYMDGYNDALREVAQGHGNTFDTKAAELEDLRYLNSKLHIRIRELEAQLKAIQDNIEKILSVQPSPPVYITVPERYIKDFQLLMVSMVKNPEKGCEIKAPEKE